MCWQRLPCISLFFDFAGFFRLEGKGVCNHPWANDPPNFNLWSPPNISPRPTEPSATITSTSSSSVPTSHEPPIAHSIGSTTTTTATSTSGQTESPTVPARSSFSTARTQILQELRSGRWESVLLKQQLVLLMALTVNLAQTAKQMASHGLTDPITVFSQPRHSIFLCSNDPGVAVVGQFVSQSNNQARITANQWKGNRRTKKMDRRSRKGTARNSNHDDNERRLEKQPSSSPRTSTSSFVNFTKNQETTLTQSKFSKAERRKYHKTKERHAILLKKFRRDIGYVDACYEAKYEGRPLPKLVVAVGSYAFGFAGHVRGVAAGAFIALRKELERIAVVFETKEALSTKSHSGCLCLTLATPIQKTLNSVRKSIWDDSLISLRGLRFCEPCRMFVDRDLDAAIVILLIALAGYWWYNRSKIQTPRSEQQNPKNLFC